MSARNERTGSGAAFGDLARQRQEAVGAFSAAGYRRTAEIKRPELGGFAVIIDARLAGDQVRNRKQRRTAKRVLERL